MVEGIETVAIYVTPEVVAELGEVLKALKNKNITVGGALHGDVRPVEYLNDAIEYLIESKLMGGYGYGD